MSHIPTHALELVYVDESDTTHRFRLFHRLRIGRADDNDVCLSDDETVSRYHGVVILGRSGARYEDVGSRTGSEVNGAATTSTRLREGDRLRIGATELRLLRVRPAGETRVAATETSPWAFAVTPSPEHESAARNAVVTQFRSYAVVREVIRALGDEEATPSILGRVADAVFRVCGADRVHLVLLDPDSGALMPAIARHRDPEIGAIRAPLSRSIIEEAIATRRAVRSDDALADQRFGEGQSILDFAIRSVLCAPILAGARAVGALQVDRVTPGARFDEGDAELVEILGAVVGSRLDALRWEERARRAEAALRDAGGEARP